MTAKTPDSPQESRPATASSSTPVVPAQPAQPPTVTMPAVGSAAPAATTSTPAAVPAPATTPAAVPATTTVAVPAKATPTPPKPPAPAGKTVARRRGGSGGAAFVIAVIAVLIAIGSILVALTALDVAREAKSKAADTAGARSAGPPAVPAITSSQTSGASPSPTVARVQFVPENSRVALRIPAADGCASVFVDLDSMQVGVDNGHEFYLSSCLGTTSLRIDKTSGSAPTGPNPTPEVCVAQLAGATPNVELVLPVHAGLTFCLLTNKEQAVRQGLPQRVGIVEVRELGADKSVTLTVSTYLVPE
jgi:hypothetical protein